MSKHPPVVWCNCAMIQCPSYGLCLSERSFIRELKRLGIRRARRPPWITPGADASVHYFEHAKRRANCSVVCINAGGHSLPHVLALLVHEAMHLWRSYREDIKEAAPSTEFEAYFMQSMTQSMFTEYLKLTSKPAKRSRKSK